LLLLFDGLLRLLNLFHQHHLALPDLGQLVFGQLGLVALLHFEVFVFINIFFVVVYLLRLPGKRFADQFGQILQNLLR